MKRSFMMLTCAAVLMAGASCNSNDSVKQAQKTNET